MNQYVSQGVFDRRVKLIEEKLKHIDGGVDKALLDKLEKENQYYVDQIVDNINSGIISFDSINQQIADALDAAEGYTDIASQTATQNNNAITTIVNEFINGYNNFAANTLRFNDVFDSDGEFTGKIRPTSIETAALFVGTRSQQLALNGIEFRVLPYEESTNDKGVLQIISSEHSKNGTITQNERAGFMFHYGFGTDTAPKVYVVNEAELDIKTDLQKVSNHTLVSIENDEYEANKGVYIYAKLTSKNEDYKKVENIDSNIFNKKYLFLYTKDGNNYPRVAGGNYSSIATYYVKNPAYVEDNTKSLTEYLEYTINNEESFIESVGKIYTKSGNDYNLVTKTSYSSGIDYYEINEESEVKNTATTESDATTGAGGQHANDFIADIFISQEQIKLKDITNYLVIKLGYISIATNASKPNLKQRKVDMTYGSTTIDGRLITTGKIEGNGVSINLDTGDIVGKITFKTNDGDMSADTYIQSKYEDIYSYVFNGEGNPNEGIKDYVNSIKSDLEDQIDGVVDSYFMEGVPTLLTTKKPISDWYVDGTINYNNHNGDTYTDILPNNFDLSEIKNNLPLWIEQGGLYTGMTHYGETFDIQEYDSQNYCRLKGILSFNEGDIISAPPFGVSMRIAFYDNKQIYRYFVDYNTSSYTFTSSDVSNYKYFTLVFRATNNYSTTPISPSDFINNNVCLMSSTGDIKYTFSGHSWRFVYENNMPQWLVISDSEVAKALQLAAEAQDTADGKRRVFITDEGVLPTPPYDKGDLWANATYPANGCTYNNCLLRCKTARASGATANISDWQDSNRALQEIDNVTNDGIISKGSEKSSLKKEWEEIKSTYSKAITAITTFDVSTEVSSEKSALDDAYDDLEDVMDVVLGNNDSNINNDTYIGATYNGSPRYDIVISQTNVTANIFRIYWKTYYEAETALNDAIQKKAQDKISAYVKTINAETTAIKDGTTTIAGGMVKSNLIELNKFKYTEVESGSSFNPNTSYYIKQGNTYLYQRGLTSFLPGVTYYTASSGGVNSGVSGIDDFPAFWAGGSAVDAGNVRTTRDNAQIQTIAGQVQALKNAINSLPPVFIDFDGISRFGDMWLYGGQIDWQPNFDSYIKIGGAYLIWDNTNKALRLSDQPLINGTHTNAIGLWADGFVSALGANNSGGGGGGGDLNYADLWNELTSSSSEHYAGSTIINSTHLPLGYTYNNRNYPVQANDNKLYVNVPWTDTIYKLSLNGTQYGSGSTSLGSFYAPTQVGSNNYILKSNGSGEPSWVAQSNLNVGTANTWTTARTLTVGATGKSVNGSANVSWNTTEINNILLGNLVGRIVIALCELQEGTTTNVTKGWSGRIIAMRSDTGDDFAQWADIDITAAKQIDNGFRYSIISTSKNSNTTIAVGNGFRACRFQYTKDGVTKWYGGLEFYNSWGNRNFYANGVYLKNAFTPFIVQYATMSNSVATATNTEIYNSIDFSSTYCIENGVAYKGTINGYTLSSNVNSGNIKKLAYYNNSSQIDDTNIESDGNYIKIGNNTSADFIQIGDGKIVWENGGIHIYNVNSGQTAGLYADWISALGANSGGGSGGSGINWADFWNELNLSETHSYSGTKIIDKDYLPINGVSSSNGTFYAPVSSGTSGMFLKSSGTNNAPVWSNLASSDIPNLSASKINSGTFDVDRIPTLSITDKTSGTLPITRGGTGATSAKGAEYNILSNASTALETDFNNTTRFAIEHTNPSSTNGILIGYRTASQLWSYIKGKMSSDSAVNISGNAATATILQTTRTINGTNFNGSTNITTSTWGTTRNISISDADETNISDAVSVNGSENKTLKLPSTIKASLNGTINGYSISSTVNSGTANRLAYYSGANAIDDATYIGCDGTRLCVGENVDTNYAFKVSNGRSYTEFYPAADFGSNIIGFNARCRYNPSGLNGSNNFEAVGLLGQYIGAANNTNIDCYGIKGLANNDGTYHINGRCVGIQGFALKGNTNYGVQASLSVDTSSTTNIGFTTYLSGTPASNSINMGINIENLFSAGTNYGIRALVSGATSGTNYAVYASATSGTNNWGIYSYRGKNYFYDSVGIGTTNPPAKLSVAGDIYASGGVTALQAVSSDKRLKKNIKKFNAKNIIDKLNPVSFEWNSKAKKLSDFQDGKNYGLIAQDSDNIIDNFVFDLPDGNGYKGVRYEKLIPILLQAIKEQQKEIDELKQQIKQLIK